MYYGRLRVNKPRRLVWAAGSDDVEPVVQAEGRQEGAEGGNQEACEPPVSSGVTAQI